MGLLHEIILHLMNSWSKKNTTNIASSTCKNLMNYLDKKLSGLFSVLANKNVSRPSLGCLKCRVIWSKMWSEGATDGLRASYLRQTTPQYATYCSPICRILVTNMTHIASRGMALFSASNVNALIINRLNKTRYFAIFSAERHPASKYASFRGGVFGIFFTFGLRSKGIEEKKHPACSLGSSVGF